MKSLQARTIQRFCISSGLLATLAVAAIAIATPASAGEIQWRSPQADQVARAAIPVGQSIADQIANLASASGQKHVVLQLNRPANDELRAELQG